MTHSYDLLIDGEPYIYEGIGIELGDALNEPGIPTQLGSAIIENVSAGVGPKVNRGNGYYDIHRLIPSVEGQLIFNPLYAVGAPHSLGGQANYTPGVHHHPFAAAGAQYIAYGSAIFAIFLTDVVTKTYTNISGSDPTGINSAARYTGGAFVWRNRIYFGIENGLNGEALGYAYVDADTPTVALVVSDIDKGFSYGASGRGRLFLAQNGASVPGTAGIRLKWSPKMDVDYSDMVLGTDLFGDTGTFVYGIENRPRVTWVGMQGSSVLFFLADGSVLASDETGFLGIAASRAQASAAEDNFQGFGAVPYLDGMAYRVNYGGPHHINPVTLLTRSLSVGNVQDVPLDVHDVAINCMTSVGEHLLMAGNKYLYDIVWTGNLPIVHKLLDLHTFLSDDFVAGDMTYQGGLLVITMISTSQSLIQQIHTEPLPAVNVSVSPTDDDVQAWIRFGTLSGPSRAAHMTKLWLQIRGTDYTQANPGNSLTFTNGRVDEEKDVNLDPVTAPGPWVSKMRGDGTAMDVLGRTLSFRMNFNVEGWLGFNERVYLPIVADFLWCPTHEDMITISLRASSEQAGRAGGMLQARSARTVVDTLLAKQNKVITVTFADGSPQPQTWTMFVETADAQRGVEMDTRAGDAYVVKLACRRLYRGA